MLSSKCFLLSALLGLFPVAQAQEPAPTFANARELLDAVARRYAADAATFHFEWSVETVENREQLRSWKQSVYSALRAPGGQFRLEARTPMGDWLQQSDGTTEWKFVREAKVYEKHSAGAGPTFPQAYGFGSMELQQAWDVRKKLDSDAETAKEATLGVDETVMIEGRAYPCYVVHATMKRGEYSGDQTLWIEKQTLLVRKLVRHENTQLMLSNTVHLPVHTDSTTVYTVAELSAETDPKLFSLILPADAKEVAALEPGFAKGAPLAIPPPQLTGKLLPDVLLSGTDGKPVKLSSFRGQPLVIDIWATWCGPCLT